MSPETEGFSVSIVTSDRGWILERLAHELTTRHSEFRLDPEPDTAADIVYYLNYSARRSARAAPIEIAYFTHVEPGLPAEQRFFDTALEMDWCVCHSELYAAMLRDHGIARVTVIPPGLDRNELFPRLKVGVVGRTYHTGRKGESLVAKVLDIEGVEWHFTGEGWPLPSRVVPAGGMGEFYRAMDYVLVASNHEGGPMCVPEALACGTPVVAPAIGWVPQFPHLEYPVGDSVALRRLLESLVAEKAILARATEMLSWERWADEHHRLFSEIVAERGGSPARRASMGLSARRSVANADGDIAHVLHGNERIARGGPSVRVPETARRLRLSGIDARICYHPVDRLPEGGIVHLYNVWKPRSALAAMRAARARGNRIIFSPIFLDLAFRALWEQRLPGLIPADLDPERARQAFHETDRRHCALMRKLGIGAPALVEPFPGFNADVAELLRMADHVICLSRAEQRALELINGGPFASSVVHNPVDAERWNAAAPDGFCASIGLDRYAICLGRIEPRKNQAAIALALRDSGLPVVFVGRTASSSYQKIVAGLAGPDARFVDHLAHDDPLLASALKGASVLVSVSWAEGASLALLEGAAAGAPLLVQDGPAEREYLGEHARYVRPADLEAVRSGALELAEVGRDPEARLAHMRTRFGWEHHVSELAAIYARIAG